MLAREKLLILNKSVKNHSFCYSLVYKKKMSFNKYVYSYRCFQFSNVINIILQTLIALFTTKQCNSVKNYSSRLSRFPKRFLRNMLSSTKSRSRGMSLPHTLGAIDAHFDGHVVDSDKILSISLNAGFNANRRYICFCIKYFTAIRKVHNIFCSQNIFLFLCIYRNEYLRQIIA